MVLETIPRMRTNAKRRGNDLITITRVQRSSPKIKILLANFRESTPVELMFRRQRARFGVLLDLDG